MKKIIYLALIFFCFSCYQPERNCQDYKTGTFRFDYEVKGIMKTGRFERSEKFSVDYFEGKIDSSSVRWINNCEFILKKINPKTNSEKDAIHFKILTTTDSSYTFEYKLAVKKLNAVNRIEKGTAYIIND